MVAIEYMLRTCASDMISYRGFVWPTEGPVQAPDWDPSLERGGGLHGLLRGEGNGSLLDWSDDAVWMVVAVPAEEVVDLDGKAKAPRGWVVHCGDRASATSWLRRRYPGAAIVGGTATAGSHGTATVGSHGTATAGDHGTATAGYRGTATAGTGGVIQIRRWDGIRHRIIPGHIGEDGLKPGVAYRLDRDGRFVGVCDDE